MIVKLVEIGVDMNAPHGIKHARSQGVIDFAYRIARDAHSGQERKYTHDPYIVHPVAVARTVASVTEDCEMISAALLHDVIEDTPFTFEQIKDSVLGYRVADIVRELTNATTLEFGNRAKRKAFERDRLARVSDAAQTVKLADLIDNSHSIIKYDPNFAKVFMREMAALLDVLVRGDERLLERADEIVEYYL